MPALVDYALTSLSTAKEYLGISGTSKDDLIRRLINASTEYIENYCKRRFISTTHTNEMYDGNNYSEIQLKNYPIVSVSSLQYRDSLDYSGGGSWESVNASDYYYEADTGRVYVVSGNLSFESGISQRGFNHGFRNWRVTYIAGYATIPYDLEEACLQLINYLYKNAKAKGVHSERLGEYAITWFQTGATSAIKELGIDDILDAYRTPTTVSS
jgi:uncharacterized phiE125 gp8 family phage protein